jgi:hypothetical protein
MRELLMESLVRLIVLAVYVLVITTLVTSIMLLDGSMSLHTLNELQLSMKNTLIEFWHAFLFHYCKVDFVCWHSEPNWLGWIFVGVSGISVLLLVGLVVELCKEITEAIFNPSPPNINSDLSEAEDRQNH